MNKTTTLIIVLLLTLCATASAENARQASLWPLVAQSQIIVSGTLSVPISHIRSRLASGKHDYVEIDVTLEKALKGSPPEKFVVSWYTEPRDYAPAPEHVIKLNGKRALLYLVQIDEGASHKFYFAGYTPQSLATATTARIHETQSEVLEQRQILSNFSNNFPPSSEPLYERVKSLIEATTRNDSQMAAFRQLEDLGPAAVPSIIMLMDDRRDLAIPSISLINKSPDAFEGIRHYGPRKIVDAMDAILNQITGYSFGDIYNSGSERERQAAVDGWRVYLHHLKFDTQKRQ